MEELEKFYINPDITAYLGIRVKKNTSKIFENGDKTIKQELKNLVLTTKIKRSGENFETESLVKNNLQEGEILLFSNTKGYQVPGIAMSTAKQIKEDFENMI